MGLIAAGALSGFAGTMEAEGNQQQAHGFRMQELDQEAKAWVARMEAMNQGRIDAAAIAAQGKIDTANINQSGQSDRAAMKQGPGLDPIFNEDLQGGSGTPAPSGNTVAPVPAPASMPRTLTPPAPPTAAPGNASATQDASSPPPSASTPPDSSQTQSGSPLIRQPGADTSADLNSQIVGGAAPKASGPAGAPTPKVSDAQNATSQILSKYGFDDPTITRISHSAVKQILLSKEPWQVNAFLENFSRLMLAAQNGDYKTASNIGTAMGNSGWLTADQATTIVDKTTGQATTTPYGNAVAAKDTAQASKAGGNDLDKQLTDLQKEADGARKDATTLTNPKPTRDAAAQRLAEINAKIDQITAKRTGAPQSTTPSPSNKIAGPPIKIPAPPSGFRPI